MSFIQPNSSFFAKFYALCWLTMPSCSHDHPVYKEPPYPGSCRIGCERYTLDIELEASDLTLGNAFSAHKFEIQCLGRPTIEVDSLQYTIVGNQSGCVGKLKSFVWKDGRSYVPSKDFVTHSSGENARFSATNGSTLIVTLVQSLPVNISSNVSVMYRVAGVSEKDSVTVKVNASTHAGQFSSEEEIPPAYSLASASYDAGVLNLIFSCDLPIVVGGTNGTDVACNGLTFSNTILASEAVSPTRQISREIVEDLSVRKGSNLVSQKVKTVPLASSVAANGGFSTVLPILDSELTSLPEISRYLVVISARSGNAFGYYQITLTTGPSIPSQAPSILNFADNILPLALVYCMPCHTEATNKSWWTTSARRVEIIARVTNKTMPQTGSSQASQMSTEQRAKILTWLGLSEGRSASPLFHPRVFDWQKYVALYPDLGAAKITDEFSAASHWELWGARDARRASDLFSAPEYLAYYSDIKQAFGTDYVGAITHYVQNGIAEGRLGRIPK